MRVGKSVRLGVRVHMWMQRHSAGVCCLSLLAAGVAAQQPERALRVIADSATGTHWLLAANPTHPGGPGRLVPERGAAIMAPVPQVIRAGDRLLVVESSETVEACFDAVALEPAVLGSVFTARFTAGGGRVRVVALGPGRAALAPGPALVGGQP